MLISIQSKDISFEKEINIFWFKLILINIYLKDIKNIFYTL